MTRAAYEHHKEQNRLKDVLLQLRDIHVSYGGVIALDGVSMHIDEGEIVVLMGPNGAGKSTVLRAIFGLAAINRGALLWHGMQLRPVPYDLVNRGIAYVPQGRRVFSSLSVRENLDAGAQTVISAAERERRIREILDIFPVLKQRLRARAGELSGGQQQMLALARGLMADPKILLLDEPSLGLAPKIVKQVFEKIREINERHRTAILIVEHNLRSALALAMRVYVLDKGRVLMEDKPDRIHSSKILETVFLGAAPRH